MSMTAGARVDVRLTALRAVDAVLAALQVTFQMPRLINGVNPYRFVPNDPVNSTLWISDAEGRLTTERGGARSTILVDRSDYMPSNNHLHNYAGQDDYHGGKVYADLGTTQIIVTCEGGNRLHSETLASIVYQIIKAFRHDIMAEFDLHDLRPMSVGRATRLDNITGNPWRTPVLLKVETQERLIIDELANPMNRADFAAKLHENAGGRTVSVVSLDGGLEESPT
jgi:hypothetical protein